MPKTLRENHLEFIRAAESQFPELASSQADNRVLSRSEVLEVCDAFDLDSPNWLTVDKKYRAARGAYLVPSLDGSYNPAGGTDARKSKTRDSKAPQTKFTATVVDEVVASKPKPTVMNAAGATVAYGAPEDISFVPSKMKGFVKWGHFRDLHRIVKSERFFPVYVTGLSGNGKTTMVEQICADIGREFFRVNITRETNESDLLGSFRLVNGETVFEYGPVVNAMLRGAVLLLDEVDLAQEDIMCLQPVLEGKPIFLKKISKWIAPARGFTVFATANTKGRGSSDGKFVGANYLNEAFLDRFPVTYDQPYPSVTDERKILKGMLNAQGVALDDDYKSFIDCLVQWGDTIRKTYLEGGVSEIVSTRRLLNGLEFYSIFRSDRASSTAKYREKAVGAIVSRFSDEDRDYFTELYNKIDETLREDETEGESQTESEISTEAYAKDADMSWSSRVGQLNAP